MAKLIGNADGSRILWFGGEMELLMGLTVDEAYERCANIAEQCGYLVTSKGRSAFSICGGDIVGYYVLEWFDSTQPGPEKIEHWTCLAFYVEPRKALIEAEEKISLDELEESANARRAKAQK